MIQCARTVVAAAFFGDKKLVFILVGPVVILYVPVLFGLDWLYAWRDSDDPVKFLGYWCSASALSPNRGKTPLIKSLVNNGESDELARVHVRSMSMATEKKLY